MKRLILLIPLLFAGCSTTNVSDVVKALGQDTNSVHVTITTVYGTVDIQRNLPAK